METEQNQEVASLSKSYSGPTIAMWLHNRPPLTAKAYFADVQKFFEFCKKEISDITLADLQGFDASMTHLAASSRNRRIASVKSLISFAHKLGVLKFDAGRPMRMSKVKATAVERILSVEQVNKLLLAAKDPMTRALINLLYVCGLRSNEVATLRWNAFTKTKEGVEARVIGKGDKMRSVMIPRLLWHELCDLPRDPRPDAAVITMKDGAPISNIAILRHVKSAAKKAGLPKEVSPHWLRHSHASHALENNCPPHVLQQSLGHASLATTTKYLHMKKGDGSSNFVGK